MAPTNLIGAHCFVRHRAIESNAVYVCLWFTKPFFVTVGASLFTVLAFIVVVNTNHLTHTELFSVQS